MTIQRMTCGIRFFIRLQRCCRLFFILQQKDLNMQKVSYIYSGETRTFYFNFPYFEKSNIVVTVDNKPAPAYNVIGVKGGLNPDFPFSSGKIVFVKPLKLFQSITIERHLPYERPVDFQPTAKISPMDLNLDMNNTIELLKDLRDEVDDLRNKYKDITDKEQIDNLLEKIELVNQNIATLSDQIAALDGISTILDDIDDLQGAVSSHDDQIGDLQTSVNNITQNPPRTIPDYSATPIALSTSTNTWTSVTLAGALHVKFQTTDAVSWLTVALGTENNYVSLAAHVNENDRISDVLYNVQAGQKFKLSPRNATIIACELIPFC